MSVGRRKFGVSEMCVGGRGRCRGRRVPPPWEARAVVARAALRIRPPWRPQQREARRRCRLASKNARKMLNERTRPALGKRSGGAPSRCVSDARSRSFEDTSAHGRLGQAKAVASRSRLSGQVRRCLRRVVMALLLVGFAVAHSGCDQTLAGSWVRMTNRGEPDMGCMCSDVGCASQIAVCQTTSSRGASLRGCLRPWVLRWDCWIRTGAG